jgi:hypothetical protein
MPEPDRVTRGADGKLTVETRGGQGLLRDMIADYYAAHFETNPNRRQELLLRANARGGLHEQTRLQTYIAGALDAPIADLLMPHAHAEIDKRHGHGLSAAVHALCDRLLPPICKRLEKAWEDFSTLAMMELTLPDAVLHLSQPLPSEPGRPVYPPLLATIDDPPLRRVLSDYDALDIATNESLAERIEDRFASLLHLGHPVHPAMIAAGATDWTNLRQRMKLIFALFRSRADDFALASQPFTDVQRAAIASGTVPPGPL